MKCNADSNRQTGSCTGGTPGVTKMIRDYLNEHPANYPECVDSLLEMLYFWHTQYNPVENESVREAYQGLCAWLHELSRDEEEEKAYMNMVNKACSEYERAAYIEGIKVGMRLVMEAMEADGGMTGTGRDV